PFFIQASSSTPDGVGRNSMEPSPDCDERVEEEETSRRITCCSITSSRSTDGIDWISRCGLRGTSTGGAFGEEEPLLTRERLKRAVGLSAVPLTARPVCCMRNAAYLIGNPATSRPGAVP